MFLEPFQTRNNFVDKNSCFGSSIISLFNCKRSGKYNLYIEWWRVITSSCSIVFGGVFIICCCSWFIIIIDFIVVFLLPIIVLFVIIKHFRGELRRVVIQCVMTLDRCVTPCIQGKNLTTYSWDFTQLKLNLIQTW